MKKLFTDSVALTIPTILLLTLQVCSKMKIMAFKIYIQESEDFVKAMLNNLVQDLGLPKYKSELLGSRQKQGNLKAQCGDFVLFDGSWFYKAFMDSR